MATPNWSKGRFLLLAFLGAAWLGFQLYVLFSPQPPLVGRSFHLGFALLLFLVAVPEPRGKTGRIIDAILALGVVAVLIYYPLSLSRLSDRMEAVDPVLTQDLIFGGILLLIVLECVRRVVGWSLLGVLLAFLLFAFIGQLIPSWTSQSWVPELFKYSGFTPGDAAESFTMTANGLLGITTQTSLGFVFYFVLFGALYAAIGGAQLFIDIGLRLTGRQRGGPAKAAVVASGLMGSISGSAVANVATTGIFTIPLMLKAGYRRTMAGAIEAISSTGGQLMPPVMGIAAFVMADLLQEDYSTIALAGVIPALAFYWSVFLAVDLHARRSPDLANSGEATSPDSPSLRSRLYLLLPLAILLGLLFTGFSAALCAVSASAGCLIVGLLQRKLSAKDWLEVLIQGTRQAAQVAIPIAAVGLIIEISIQTNLVLKFSVDLLELSGGTMLGALFWIILGCLIMGMGLPTVAAYIIGATLFVPALVEFGLPKLGCHFFVMYFCVLSMITPPIALASYTAAGLAEAPVMKTCFAALRLAAAAFIIPFAFLFSPALLAQGTMVSTIAQAALLLAGTSIWAMAAQGYFLGRLPNLAQRLWLGTLAVFTLTLPATVPLLSHSTALAWCISLAISIGGLILAWIWTKTTRPDQAST